MLHAHSTTRTPKVMEPSRSMDTKGPPPHAHLAQRAAGVRHRRPGCTAGERPPRCGAIGITYVKHPGCPPGGIGPVRTDLGGGHLSGLTTAHPPQRRTREQTQSARGVALCTLSRAPRDAPRAPQLHPAHLVSCLDARCTRPGRVGAHGLRENKWELGGEAQPRGRRPRKRARKAAPSNTSDRDRSPCCSRALSGGESHRFRPNNATAGHGRS